MGNSYSLYIPCEEVASKARRMLFMIRRSFAEISVSAFAPLSNALVRPHLKYAMQSCSPNPDADAGCLGQIQRLATMLVKGFRRLLYEGRLRRLGLHSLNRRRLRGDLIAAYKVFSRVIDLELRLFFIPPVRPGLRGHPFKALQGPSRRLRRKPSFSIRVVKY